MLPASIARQVFGARTKRAVEFTSEDAQLIGRSRAERLLDGIYNHQSRDLREKRRHEVAFSSEGHPPLKARKVEVSPKSDSDTAVKSEKVELDKVKVEESSRSEEVTEVKEAVGSLIRHLNSKSKLPKVITLAEKLFDKYAYPETCSQLSLLLTAIACSPHLSEIPSLRRTIIKFFKSATAKLKGLWAKSSIASSTEDRESFDSLPGWIEVLKIPGIFCLELFTDDSFQFNQAVSKLLERVLELPTIEEGETKEHPIHDYLETLQQVVPSKKGVDKDSHNINSPSTTTAAVSGDASPVTPRSTFCFPPSHREAHGLVREFLFRSFPTIFAFAKTKWAKPKVTEFFSRVFLIRCSVFTKQEISQIENWQSELRSTAHNGQRHRGASALDFIEAAHPIRDGREERVFAVHGAEVWSSKQLGL